MSLESNGLIQKGFRPISGWTLLLFVAVLAVLCAGTAWYLRDHPRGLIGILGLFYIVGLVSVALAVAPLGRSAAPALGIRGANWRYAVFGALGTLALSVVVSQIGPEPEGMKQVMELAQDPRKLLPSFVAFALLAPLVEELVFRGLLYGWLAGRWGAGVAVVGSTIAFAAAHVELAHVVLVLPLGLVFGCLRWRTGALWPSLVAHMANNGLAVVAATYLDI